MGGEAVDFYHLLCVKILCLCVCMKMICYNIIMILTFDSCIKVDVLVSSSIHQQKIIQLTLIILLCIQIGKANNWCKGDFQIRCLENALLDNIMQVCRSCIVFRAMYRKNRKGRKIFIWKGIHKVSSSWRG
jgi:hypothetical protein